MKGLERYTIYIGGDHAGFFMKETLITMLKDLGYDVLDFGPEMYDPLDDYPDFLHPLALMLSTNPHNSAIVLGGSGTGEAIVLNRYPDVRCVQFYGSELEIIEKARIHNHANALSIGVRFTDERTIKKAVLLFLETTYSHEQRHETRIKKIESLLAHHTGDYTEQ